MSRLFVCSSVAGTTVHHFSHYDIITISITTNRSMFALLAHKWHIWLAWTSVCHVVFIIVIILQLISPNGLVALAEKKNCSSNDDLSLAVPECFSRRCQHHRQCSSDCPNTFCSADGRCLCESGFRVDLSAQNCLKEVPLWLILTVMGAIFAVAYLITFCCLKHDLLFRLKQLRPEAAVRFTAVNQHQQQPQPSSGATRQHQRLHQSLDNVSISSSSSSSLSDTFTQCPLPFRNSSITNCGGPLSGSASAGAARRTPIPASQTYAINPKGRSSFANYENITPQAVSSTEI